jgi:hypothetical protein
MCQISEPAVDHPSRPATGSTGEIPFLHQNNAQPSYGGIPGNPGPGNTSSNHNDVKQTAFHLFEIRFSDSR